MDLPGQPLGTSNVRENMTTGPIPLFTGGSDMGPAMAPLLPTDPPKIGDFWLDGRLTASPSGIAYAGHADDGSAVMLVLLSAGAAEDAAARDRFAGQVNKMHIDTVLARGGQGQQDGRLGFRFRSEDDDPVEPGHQPLAPWVALAYDGTPAALAEADRLLAEIDLSQLPEQGQPSGPDYALHWVDNAQPGVSRLWPLPWPGRYDRAGRVSVVASWLLMMLIGMLAILLAILIFSHSDQQSPPPPLPTTASPQSGSPPPESASPSPESASPSPQSASPSPGSASPSGSPSGSASPTPSGSQSGSPSPSGSQSASASPSPASGSPGPSGSTVPGAPTTTSKL